MDRHGGTEYHLGYETVKAHQAALRREVAADRAGRRQGAAARSTLFASARARARSAAARLRHALAGGAARPRGA